MYTITPSTLADIPELLPLINSAYRGDASRKGWTTEADLIEGSLRTDAEHLAGLIRREQAAILKYVDDAGQIAGCVFLENQNGRLYLGMFSVYPERQGEGIGKRILAAADAYARDQNCRSIFMQVISLRSELIAWYERYGYRDTGLRKPFESPEKFGVPRQPLEFVILEKIL